MTFTLFLLNKKGYSVLKTLINKNYIGQIDKVIISKDKGNKEDYYEGIKSLAIDNNIPVFERNEVFNISSNYSIAIGWRWLIRNIENLIVFHDSPLPKYRGFAPLVNMLINGENILSVTAIFANENIDEGDIILQEHCNISYPIKINKAIDLVSELYILIALKIFESTSRNEHISSFSQNNKNATYSLWRDKADYLIDWTKSSEEIKRFVDAVGYPYDGATIVVDQMEIQITDVTVIEDFNFEIVTPGKIFTLKDGKPIVCCGTGAIRIDKCYLNGEEFNFRKVKYRL